MRLDRLDVGILRLLQADARLSFRQIADRLGTTTPTVSARVKALEALGILRGYRAIVDAGVLGGSTVVLRVTASPSAADRVARALADVPGVEEVLLLAGGALLARVRLRLPERSLADLHATLAGMPEVASYEASEVLAVKRLAEAEPLPDEVDVKCHQCGGPIHGDPHQKTLDGRAHVFCCKGCLSAFVKRFERVKRAA